MATDKPSNMFNFQGTSGDIEQRQHTLWPDVKGQFKQFTDKGPYPHTDFWRIGIRIG